MYGKVFCDVCDHWFHVDTHKNEATCPGCHENVLPDPVDELDDLFGLDHQDPEPTP